MSNELYNKLEGGPLVQSNLKLKTYSGELLKPVGIGRLEVEYNSIKLSLPIVVLEGKVPTLLGRN